jgi:tellurite resistance protein
MTESRNQGVIVQAAFDVLYLLSTVDGYAPSEGQVISEFLQRNYHQHFDYRAEAAMLGRLQADECHTRFTQALRALKEYATPEERRTMLRFALDLALADGDVTAFENALVNELAHTWDINLVSFLLDYLKLKLK